MKSYTDLEQSKKLAEILPIESADMYWFRDNVEVPYVYPKDMMKDSVSVTCPCWSLAALLRLIPNFNIFKRTIECRIETTDHFIDKASDPIDVAFEMICWLKEHNKI